MKKKLSSLLIAIVSVSLVLAGCSGSSKDSKNKVTLQMVESLTNPDRTKLIKSLLKKFEKENPEIKVKLVSPPTDQADQKIRQMLDSKSGVDVLEVRDLTVGPFSTNGWLKDLAPELKGWDGWDKLTENARNVTKNPKGNTWYIPYGFYGLSLFYRTDLIKEKNFSNPPETWEELLKQASTIQNPSQNLYGYALRGGKNSMGQIAAILEAYNADNLDTSNAYFLKNGKTIFSSKESQQAMELYLKLFKKGSPPSAVSWGYPEMVEGFSNGSVAFLLQDPEVIATLNKATAIKKNQWTTAPLLCGPSGKAGQAIANAGWGIAKSSKHQKESLKLIKWLTTQASTEFAKKNSLVPILKKADEDKFFKTGAWKSYVTMTNNPKKWILVKEPRDSSSWTKWMQKSESEFQRVLIGKMSIPDLLVSWDKYWASKK